MRRACRQGYNGTTFPGVSGTKTEIRPGVWRLRVYAGRRASGTPIQISKTFVSPEVDRSLPHHHARVRAHRREGGPTGAGQGSARKADRSRPRSPLRQVDRQGQHGDHRAACPCPDQCRAAPSRAMGPRRAQRRPSSLAAESRRGTDRRARPRAGAGGRSSRRPRRSNQRSRPRSCSLRSPVHGAGSCARCVGATSTGMPPR